MARTAYAVVKYDKTTGIVDMTASGVKQAVDAITGVGNGVSVTNAFNTKHDSLRVRVTNTHTSAHNMTFKAGTFINSILGDKAISIPASGEYDILVSQPDRLQQKDGSLVVEFDAGFTGTFAAIAEGSNIG